MGEKQNSSMIRSLSIIIAVLFSIEIVTYAMVYINLKSNSNNATNDIMFFIIPPIIYMIAFYISFKAIEDEENSIFSTLLSILASWTPFFLVPTFIDNNMLETLFTNLEIVKLLPKISIAIGVVSTLKGIGAYTIKSKKEKEARRERELQIKRERRELYKQELLKHKNRKRTY
ncbi:MAG: hypothetical protein ACRDC3_06840 [Paraclostridium dentum]|uniref:hypothetical protein n=1 Tax=Paraclostridium dentum TaxID=2662455 RepID=UPI003EE60EF9